MAAGYTRNRAEVGVLCAFWKYLIFLGENFDFFIK